MSQVTLRRLVKSGNSVVITLPPGWLRWAGLKAGNRVQVTTNSKVVIEKLEQGGKDANPLA